MESVETSIATLVRRAHSREPSVAEPLRADGLDADENVGIVLTAVDYPIFEELGRPAQKGWFGIPQKIKAIDPTQKPDAPSDRTDPFLSGCVSIVGRLAAEQSKVTV